MEYKNKQGRNKTLMFQENREKIINYFKDNPDSTQQDCADFLGLARVTVNQHIKKLRECK